MEPSPNAVPAGWQRPYHEPSGERGDALLFYVLLGDFTATFENFDLDRERWRTSGLPSGGSLEIYPNDGNPNGAFAAFLAGHLGILLDKEQPKIAPTVHSASTCIRLLARVPDPADLVYLRDTLGLVAALLDTGHGVAVLDALALRWLTPEEWRGELWEPDAPQSTHHTTILVDEEEPEQRGEPRSVWVHTRGLRKFGRPDISVRRVTQERFDLVVALCNRFIELQARGGLIPENQPLRIPDEPQDWRCRHKGDYDDPDFNNVHVAIGPERGA